RSQEEFSGLAPDHRCHRERFQRRRRGDPGRSHALGYSDFRLRPRRVSVRAGLGQHGGVLLHHELDPGHLSGAGSVLASVAPTSAAGGPGPPPLFPGDPMRVIVILLTMTLTPAPPLAAADPAPTIDWPDFFGRVFVEGVEYSAKLRQLEG